MSLQVAVTGGVEHRGSLSDCSRFVLMSLRLVLSCAADSFRSLRVLFTFHRASWVSLIAVETQSASEPRRPRGC